MKRTRVIGALIALLLIAVLIGACKQEADVEMGDRIFGSPARFLGYLLVDGTVDTDQLTVQGHSTQTNDLFVLEKSDGTEVFNVDNDGNVTLAGAVAGGGDIDMATNIITNIGDTGTDFNTSGGLTTSTTITITSGGLAVVAGGITVTAGALDMTDGQILNIGDSGTDFSGSGGLTLADALLITAGGATITSGSLDMTEGAILNIGHTGTDFSALGGLTTQAGITVTTGGLLVSAGQILFPDGAVGAPAIAHSVDTDSGFYRISEDLFGLSMAGALDFSFGVDDMDFQTSIASNIGSNDTDFRTDGGLTLAGEIIHAAGTYTLPQITFTGDPDSGFYHVGANNIGVSIGGALAYDFNATEFDVNDLLILNIGDSGTDFSGSGGLTLADTLAVTAGGITVSDGDVTVADDLIITGQTAITVTTAPFAPTGTYQPIQSAGTVTPTVTIGTAGQLVVLINIASNDIVIEDTGTTMLTGDITLQQYDSLTLWCDGTNWIMIATSNN